MSAVDMRKDMSVYELLRLLSAMEHRADRDKRMKIYETKDLIFEFTDEMYEEYQNGKHNTRE